MRKNAHIILSLPVQVNLAAKKDYKHISLQQNTYTSSKSYVTVCVMILKSYVDSPA